MVEGVESLCFSREVRTAVPSSPAPRTRMEEGIVMVRGVEVEEVISMIPVNSSYEYYPCWLLTKGVADLGIRTVVADLCIFESLALERFRNEPCRKSVVIVQTILS